MLKKSYENIIEHIKSLGYNTEADLYNFNGTPDRCVRAFSEFVISKDDIKQQLSQHVARDFPMEDDCGIVVADCTATSMCPHHLIFVEYHMYVGYLPKSNTQVIGTSKLSRICTTLAKRAVLQEQYLKDITAVLYKDGNDSDFEYPSFDSAGSFCFMSARHGCMEKRGIKMKSAVRGASVRGAFMDNPDLKDEAYNLCRLFPSDNFNF